MAVNKRSRDASALLALLVALTIMVFANLLADRGFARVDLTEEKRYSLSQPFLNILGKLDAPLQLTYYVSSKVPAAFERNKRDLLDKLGEIKTAARGLVALEIVDPSEDKELLKKLVKENPQVEIQAQSLEKDKLSFTILYSALRLTYKAKESVLLPRLWWPQDLEYALGNRILSLTLEERPLLAIHAPKPLKNYNPMGGRAPMSGFEWMADEKFYQGKFRIQQIDLTESSGIPPKCKLLALVRPENLSPRAQCEVTRYLAEGGRVLLLHNPRKYRFEFRNFDRSTTGLEPYLERIGLRFAGTCICDTNNVRLIEYVNFFTGEAKYKQNAYFVKILPANVDQEAPITRYLPSLIAPFPTEIVVDAKRAEGLGLKVSTLAKTSKQSWERPFNTLLAEPLVPPRTFDPPKAIFVQVEGRFPFPWEGRPPPPWEKTPDDEEKPAKKEDGEGGDKKAEPIRPEPGILLVWSSPESFHFDYLNDRVVGRQFRGNVTLFPNVAEVFTLGDDLVNIRAKGYETRSIATFPESDVKRTGVKLLLILGLPLLIAVFCMIRWFLRHTAQTRYEKQFAQTTGPSSFSP